MNTECPENRGMGKPDPESVMFKTEYVTTLPVAPRLFHVGDIINSTDMPKPAGVWMKRPGFLGESEVDPGVLLPSTGRVVMVFQLKRGGGGHIRARFYHDKIEWLVEYHFKSNPSLVKNK